MVDPDRLSAAYETARCDLLAESAASGHWVGQLSSSPLATATAISALTLVERHAPTAGGRFADEAREGRLSELIMASVHWLADYQNADGGWGDTARGPSNLAATMLVRAAFALTAVPATHPGLLERADAYIKSQGRTRGLRRRNAEHKPLVAAVLTNAALASLVPWRKVPALRFELACLPERARSVLSSSCDNPSLAALVAIGQARYQHRKPWNPLTYFARRHTLCRSLQVIEAGQPASGGYLESVPLTSFVVMSLASIGHSGHAVVSRGVEFLLGCVRPDGSWPLTPDLATRNTSQVVGALATAGEDMRELGCLDWLLACQQHDEPTESGLPSGGWSWTDRAGGLIDTEDTAVTLLALAAWGKLETNGSSRKIEAAADEGIRWLLAAQNADGGWPTFDCGGRGPFGTSGCDLTAQALRALGAWRTGLVKISDRSLELRTQLDSQITAAIDRGFRFLFNQQHADGRWAASWFAEQGRAVEANQVVGTARVLAAYRDLGRLDTPAAMRGLDWLAAMKHADGSWGGKPATCARLSGTSTVEETALAVEALLTCGRTPAHAAAGERGLAWLVDAVQANRHQQPSPVAVHFGRFTYEEKLNPLTCTVAALGRRVPRPATPAESPAPVHLTKH